MSPQNSHSSFRQIRMVVKKFWVWLAHTYEARATSEFQPEKLLKARKRIFRFFYHLTFATLLAAILVQPDLDKPVLPYYRAGDVIDRDIVSPVTTEIEFKEPIPSVRASLEKKVAPVFDYDDGAIENWAKKWEHAFQSIRKDYYLKKKKIQAPADIEAVSKRVADLTGQNLPPKDIFTLHQLRFSEVTEKLFVQTARQLADRLIAPTDLFSSYYRTGIMVRQVNQDLSETLVYDLSRIWSLEQVKEYLAHVPDLLEEVQVQEARRIVDVLKHVVVPNLKFNATRTQIRVSTILGMSQASVQSFRKGQIVIRRGDRLSDHQFELLNHFRALTSPHSFWLQFGFATLVTLIFIYVLLSMELTRRKTWRTSLKDSLVFMLVVLINVLFVKLSYPFVKAGFNSLGIRFGVEFFFPISFGALLMHLTIGKEAALLLSIIVSLSIGYVLDRDYFVSIWAFTVMASAVQSIKACKQRTDLYRCGLVSGAVSSVLAASFYLYLKRGHQGFDFYSFLITASFSFFAGLIAPILTGSIIPVWEALFAYTTSLKLLELSNFNHPLLHALMMKAPGTYHHSVIVGSLAEIAADRVKANGLLARVSAYYHDIGKMVKPMYFIENQSPNSNPHDQLQPSMSAKILFSHVKNGVKMAHEHSLGKNITTIIEQHHGTTLVHYFFNRAKQQENPELGSVAEGDFRYPGPKPQTREAAIVMLADACEAATRSIADPTPAKIQSMVQTIINRRVMDHQFNDCDLNFSDLQIIEECFTRTLVSLYHHRIEYPGQKKDAPPAAPPTPSAPAVKQIRGA